MYYLFAWHEGCQLGGAHDLVGMFRSLEEASAKAESLMRNDCRFEVQVVDTDMCVLFESENNPIVVRASESFSLH